MADEPAIRLSTQKTGFRHHQPNEIRMVLKFVADKASASGHHDQNRDDRFITRIAYRQNLSALPWAIRASHSSNACRASITAVWAHPPIVQGPAFLDRSAILRPSSHGTGAHLTALIAHGGPADLATPGIHKTPSLTPSPYTDDKPSGRCSSGRSQRPQVQGSTHHRFPSPSPYTTVFAPNRGCNCHLGYPWPLPPIAPGAAAR